MRHSDIAAFVQHGGSRVLYARLMGVQQESCWVRAGDLRNTENGFVLTPAWDSSGFQILWNATDGATPPKSTAPRVLFSIHHDGSFQIIGAVTLSNGLIRQVGYAAPKRRRRW